MPRVEITRSKILSGKVLQHKNHNNGSYSPRPYVIWTSRGVGESMLFGVCKVGLLLLVTFP